MNSLFKVLFALMICGAAAFANIDLSGLALNPAAAAKEPVTMTVENRSAGDADSLRLVLTLHMDSIVHIYTAESLFFSLNFSDSTGISARSVRFPSSHPFHNFDGSDVQVYTDKQQFVVTALVDSTPWRLTGTLQFQACDSRMCFTPRGITFTASSNGEHSTIVTPYHPVEPQTTASVPVDADIIPMLEGSFTVKGIRGGYLNVADFNAFLESPSADSAGGGGLFDNRGLLAIIFIILIGGIALNLTPCVLPMIPITLAVIGAGAQAKSRGRGMLTGAVYGLAMALTYGILGLVVVVSGTRFGVINASPVFNIAIAVLFVIMALAMFDIIQIDFTRFRKAGGSSGERGKLVTVFAMGVVASLLAGACVAPVVIAVVLYSGKLYAGGSVAGLALPFLLGIGMALPWPFAGAGLSLMPKPGKWMVWVKYVFGIFILGMAIYYGATGVSLFRKSMPPAAATQESASDSSGTVGHESVWSHDIGKALIRSEKEHKPVIIDFWATWCKNCHAMDATIFRDSTVIARLQGYIAVKFQAEKPDEMTTKKILDFFGIVGLPSYVILEPVKR